MAVFTSLTAPDIATFLEGYDCGQLVECTAIAEGVENTNYKLHTPKGMYVLTVVEYRTPAKDLPFIFDYVAHLAAGGMHVPLALPDRAGVSIGAIKGKPAVLAPFLKGRGVTHLTASHAAQIGTQLARMHLLGQYHGQQRPNPVGPETWQKLHTKLGGHLNTLRPNLMEETAALITHAATHASNLPVGSVHADLFPDNAFFDEAGQFSAVIDFYFSCTEKLVYDLAITANAWVFEGDKPLHWPAFINAYQAVRPLSDAEKQAFGFYQKCAALRILLTRAHDWFFRPADAVVTPKDPQDYVMKMDTVYDWF